MLIDIILYTLGFWFLISFNIWLTWCIAIWFTS